MLTARAVMRGAPTRFGLSLTMLAAASFVSVGFSANAPLIQRSFGLSHADVGAIASAVYGAAVSTSILGGRVTDRIGPGPVLLCAMAALAAGVVIAITAPDPVLFYAGVLVCGLGYGAVTPPTNVLASTRGPRRRGLAMSTKQAGIPLGGLVAGAVVPPLAGLAGWRWAMVLPAAVCLLLAAVSLRVRNPGAPAGAGGIPDVPAGQVVLRLPRGYLFGFLMAGVQVTIFAFLVVYLTQDRKMTINYAGSLLALLMIGGLVGRPVWGWLSDRWHQDRMRCLQALSLLSCVGLALVPVVSVPVLVPLILVIGLCSVGWNGVYLAAASESLPPEMLGRATGRALVLVNTGAVLLPPAFGVLLTSHGAAAGWDLCASLSLLSFAVLQFSRTRSADPGSRTC